MSAAQEPALIPLSVLYFAPDHSTPLVSPDGKSLAYLAPVEGISNIWVRELSAHDARPVTGDTARPIRTYMWAQDNHHLLYLQDQGGDENFHVFRVDVANGETRDLTPFEGVQARLLGSVPGVPGQVLVALNRDDPSTHDAYRLDVESGELTKVTDLPGAWSFGYDGQLRVLAAIQYLPDSSKQLVTRTSEDQPFRSVAAFGMDDVGSFEGELGLSADGTRVYLINAAGTDRSHLVEMDLETGGVLRVLAEDPTYDVCAFSRDSQTLAPTAATVLRARRELVVLDPSLETDFEVLRGVHPGDLSVLSMDDASTTWTVAFVQDAGPVAYYVYERRLQAAEFLFYDKARLADYTLGVTEPFTFSADDGLTVHGYITYPPGSERGDLPCVLLVHGGPWARDVWGFHPWVQQFANRGYACVQVNYRGSTGYGKPFLSAANREWGAKMHTDLLDAIDHLAGLGAIDRSRVAIVGGSYGGYAALVGATFTPDRFVCAIDVVGPSNLLTLLNSFPAYWGAMLGVWYARVGHPEHDRDFLWERSPLSRVDEIRIPMLVVQGANDPRVVKAESDQIVEAMQKKGVPHEYLVFDDEGHGFARPENMLTFAHAMDRFLGEHLGGRSEPHARQVD